MRMKGDSELGRSEFNRPVATTRLHRFLLITLLTVICLLAVVVELRPLKKIAAGYPCPIPRSNVLALAMDFKLTPAMRYTSGDGSLSFVSLPYAAAVKLMYFLVPHRLFCQRLVSVASTVVAMFFLYRTAALLFSPSVGIICVFVLITTPVYFDEMLLYGFIPFSSMVVSVTGYVLASSLKANNYAKTILLSLLAYLTLSLYAPARLVSVWVVLLYGAYFKKYWRSLAVYVVLIGVLIVGSDLIFKDAGYDFVRANNLVCPERTPFPKAGTNVQEIVREIGNRVRGNFHTASYYLSLRYKPFYNWEDQEWNRSENIFNIVYFPFLVAGIAICLVKFKKSNVYLLLWFSVFFLIIFVSSDRILERRIINGLDAVALFIALGIWGAYSFARARSLLIKHFHYFKMALGAALLLPGGYNVYNYVNSVSKPKYNYSRTQLRRFVEIICEKGMGVRSIRYNRMTEVLIWGNPYFDYDLVTRDIIDKLIDKLEVDNWDYPRQSPRPEKILEQMDYARKEGGNILYIHSYHKAAPGIPEDDLWPAADIRYAGQSLADRVEIFQIPEMDEVYFMFVKNTD